MQPDTQIEIVVTVKAQAEENPKSFIRTARALKLKGPKDFSSRVDDYLYGGANLDGE